MQHIRIISTPFFNWFVFWNKNSKLIEYTLLVVVQKLAKKIVKIKDKIKNKKNYSPEHCMQDFRPKTSSENEFIPL